MKAMKIVAGVLVAALVAVGSVNATDKTSNKKATKVAKPVAYKVDVSKSVINWNAKKVTGEHKGTVNVADGTLMVDGAKISGGSFDIDMTSIKCTDLTDPGYNGKLIGHLKSDDFFSVEKNPKANFKITKVEGANGTYNVTGDMTIKGITKPVTFPATVKMENGMVVANAKITLDRTQWDIRYGSKKFFESIGDKAIYDDFTIDLALAAKK
jgi:polyisoprenoid-binding protein YceI